MNYLGKRTLTDKCPFCNKQLEITKRIKTHIKFLNKELSYYQFRCASEDHILCDYVSLYLNTTYYRRITCTTHPDSIQLHLDFTNQISEVSIQIGSKFTNASIKFNHLLEDCNDLEKLIQRLELYQSFS